jgi:hypothetical protein
VTTSAPRNRNTSKAKGTAWESEVVKYLRANGFEQAERRALAGNADKGDILVCPGVIAECKAWATFTDGDVVEWWAETATEKKNANASVALLIIKRPRKGADRAWCWRQGEWGYWHAQFLSEALEELRDMGWGSPA